MASGGQSLGVGWAAWRVGGGYLPPLPMHPWAAPPREGLPQNVIHVAVTLNRWCFVHLVACLLWSAAFGFALGESIQVLSHVSSILRRTCNSALRYLRVNSAPCAHRGQPFVNCYPEEPSPRPRYKRPFFATQSRAIHGHPHLPVTCASLPLQLPAYGLIRPNAPASPDPFRPSADLSPCPSPIRSPTPAPTETQGQCGPHDVQPDASRSRRTAAALC